MIIPGIIAASGGGSPTPYHADAENGDTLITEDGDVIALED